MREETVARGGRGIWVGGGVSSGILKARGLYLEPLTLLIIIIVQLLGIVRTIELLNTILASAVQITLRTLLCLTDISKPTLLILTEPTVLVFIFINLLLLVFLNFLFFFFCFEDVFELEGGEITKLYNS